MSTPTEPNIVEGVDKLTVSDTTEGVGKLTVSNTMEGVEELTVVNTMEGVDELSIKIFDITTADSMADKVLELGEQASKITSIHIDLWGYMETIDEFRRSASPDVLERSSTLCAPVVSILNFIKSQNGGVKSFTWDGYYDGQKFTRPTAFWSAIFDHALTLETLDIGFFCHEGHHLAPQPPQIRFPALTHLCLDASNGDGSDGSFIDAMLHNCPNVENLHLMFMWTQYDLDACKVQNVTWTYTFPNLKKLYTDGWNFAPDAYNKFLKRHPGIESNAGFICGPYEDSD